MANGRVFHIRLDPDEIRRLWKLFCEKGAGPKTDDAMASMAEYTTVDLVILMRGLESGSVGVEGLGLNVTKEDLIDSIKQELARRGSRPA